MSFLDLVKAHLRISHYDEDDLIAQYIAAAEMQAADYLDKKIVEQLSTDPVDPDEVLYDAQIKQAVLMFVGHLYENKEAVIITGDKVEGVEIPQGFERLLWFKRKAGV